MSGNSQQRQIEQTESLRQPVVFQCCACQHRHARNIKTKQRRVLGQQLLVTFHFFCRTLTIFFDGKIRLSFGRCLVHITRSKNSSAASENAVPKPEPEKQPQPPGSAQLEKSLAVLSKLKELEFHSRANIEKLAELSLTIEEELKQKAFAEALGSVYAAQNAFQSKILELIDAYQTECTRLSGSA